MKESARYVKIVEWLEEDNCFVGHVPGLFDGGCHGDDERVVYAELCALTEEMIAHYHEQGKPLPPPTAGHDWAEAITAQVDAALANRG